MQAGQYFKKPKLLSEKIQDLLDKVLIAEPSNTGNNGLPESIYIKKPQQYQEYYHLACKQNKFYENYYNRSAKEINNQPQQQQAQQKKKPKQKPKQPANNARKDADLPAIGRCIFVVGQVLEISDHSNADSMYVEMIDIGEEKPRKICSGIKGKVSMEEMVNSFVIVFSNLKKAKLRGVESNGMILAASNEDKSKLEIVRPPKGSIIGERVVLEDEDLTQYNPCNQIKAKKKNNPWGKIQPNLKTDENGIVCYNGRKFVTSQGPLSVKSLANASIS